MSVGFTSLKIYSKQTNRYICFNAKWEIVGMVSQNNRYKSLYVGIYLVGTYSMVNERTHKKSTSRLSLCRKEKLCSCNRVTRMLPIYHNYSPAISYIIAKMFRRQIIIFFSFYFCGKIWQSRFRR